MRFGHSSVQKALGTPSRRNRFPHFPTVSIPPNPTPDPNPLFDSVIDERVSEGNLLISNAFEILWPSFDHGIHDSSVIAAEEGRGDSDMGLLWGLILIVAHLSAPRSNPFLNHKAQIRTGWEALLGQPPLCSPQPQIPRMMSESRDPYFPVFAYRLVHTTLQTHSLVYRYRPGQQWTSLH
jgi:hypothetical protein